MVRSISPLLTCLTITDKHSPFRWMGSWCAVYAPGVQLKAERRVERSRRLVRPANRRGRVASDRRKSQRALTRSAPLLVETSVPHAIERSMRRLARIDKLDNRFSAQVTRSLLSLAKLDKELSILGSSYEKKLGGRGGPGLRAQPSDYLENVAFSRYTGMRRMVQRLESACSGHWGLPRDATFKRLRMVTERVGGTLYLSDDPIWRAIPRRSEANTREYFRRITPPARFKNELVECRCSLCRRSTLCPSGHGLPSGERCCRFCDHDRHPPATPAAYRGRGSGRVRETKPRGGASSRS